jgi:uncharacterized repeat protein (TIGR01451 family)
MLDKLLANLSFNPGLTHQLAFYAKRMRGEAAIRRLGVLFITAALVIQFLAVLSPTQPTLASSSNDMIDGGIGSISQAVNACTSNQRDYGTILFQYGISCNDVASGSTVTLRSTDYNKQLYSMGHLPYGKLGETPATIGNTTVYWRYLWSWDSSSTSTYQAIQLKSHVTGRTYFLLYNCGNLVSIGLPPAAPRCQYNYFLYSNSPQCVAPCKYDTGIASNSPDCVQRCTYNSAIAATSPQCFRPCDYNKLVPTSSAQCFKPCPIVGKNNLPATSPQCVAPCPYNKNILANNDQCFQPCTYNNAIPTTSANCFPPCTYNKSIPANSPLCYKPCDYNKSIPASSPNCFKPCQYNGSIPATDSSCKPCTDSLSSTDSLACVKIHKSASNPTQGITDANNTTAKPGDVIVYTLYAQNTGKSVVKSYVFQENLSDVLDYADVTDLHSGTIDNTTHVVSWPAEDVQAGATATKQITVKVKAQIPNTPASSSDPGHFDMIMTNVYGNTVNINLPPTVITTVALVTTTTLPNTGPGTGLFFSFAIVLVASYFFFRSRLLAKEATIAIHVNTEGTL